MLDLWRIEAQAIFMRLTLAKRDPTTSRPTQTGAGATDSAPYFAATGSPTEAARFP
jgi:hypothetical protein